MHKHLLVILFFLLGSLPSFSADISNVNSSGTFQWNSTSTWIGGVIPSSGDNVILNGVSGGVTIEIPSGTFTINNLSLPNSVNLSIELEQNAVLEMTGQLIKRGTVFGPNMITSLNGGSVTGGRIKFIGSGRNIAPGSDTNQTDNYGVRDQIKNWICEIDLDSNSDVATVFSTEDFMCGRFTLRTGQFEMGSGTSLLVNRNSTGSSANGTNSSGSLFLASGTTLTTDYAGRRTTFDTYIGPLTVSTNATLILQEGGNGALNGEDITINGTLIMNGSTTILSACSTCNSGSSGNGEGDDGVVFGAEAKLEYNVPTGFTKAMGSEISRAYGGGTTVPIVHTFTVNTNNMTDRLLTTQAVGVATFANAIWISNTLNLNGIIEVGGNFRETIYLQNGAVLNGASTSNYVLITRRDEEPFQRGLRRYVNNGEALLFPIAVKANGTIERYTPFIVTNNGSNQSFSFSAMEPDSWAIDGTDQTLFPEMENNFTNSLFNDPETNRIVAADMIQDIRWDFDPNTSSADVTMKVGFGAHVTIGSNFSTNPDHYFFHNVESSAATWDEYSATYAASDPAVFDLPSLTLNASFVSSDVGGLGFGSHNSSNPLPAKLVSFQASKKENQNIITWATASEQNLSHFDIQRSEDGVTFESIGRMTAINESTSIQEYSFIDDNPLSMQYYRLAMNDFDSSSEWSNIIAVKRNDESDFIIYPNPTDDKLSISFDGKLKGLLQIINARGAIVHSLVMNGTDASKISIDISHLNPGVYLLKTSTASKLFIKK